MYDAEVCWRKNEEREICLAQTYILKRLELSLHVDLCWDTAQVVELEDKMSSQHGEGRVENITSSRKLVNMHVKFTIIIFFRCAVQGH